MISIEEKENINLIVIDDEEVRDVLYKSYFKLIIQSLTL